MNFRFNNHQPIYQSAELCDIDGIAAEKCKRLRPLISRQDRPEIRSFVAVLAPQLQFPQKLAIRCLKLSSHLLNPENSLNK